MFQNRPGDLLDEDHGFDVFEGRRCIPCGAARPAPPFRLLVIRP